MMNVFVSDFSRKVGKRDDFKSQNKIAKRETGREHGDFSCLLH